MELWRRAFKWRYASLHAVANLRASIALYGPSGGVAAEASAARLTNRPDRAHPILGSCNALPSNRELAPPHGGAFSVPMSGNINARRKLSQFAVNIWRGGHADHERTDEIMLKGLFSLAAAAALIATPAATHAFTITNQDRTKHIFIILVEDDEWNIIIQPNETLSHLCRSGCSIALGYDEDQDFEGKETVKIVDGRLIVGK